MSTAAIYQIYVLYRTQIPGICVARPSVRSVVCFIIIIPFLKSLSSQILYCNQSSWRQISCHRCEMTCAELGSKKITRVAYQTGTCPDLLVSQTYQELRFVINNMGQRKNSQHGKICSQSQITNQVLNIHFWRNWGLNESIICVATHIPLDGFVNTRPDLLSELSFQEMSKNTSNGPRKRALYTRSIFGIMIRVPFQCWVSDYDYNGLSLTCFNQ